MTPPEPRTEARWLDRAIGIIEAADGRAAAHDGPVGHVRDEMTDHEWRELYVALTKAREAAPEPPRPEIVCLCGDVFPSVEGMRDHIEWIHVGTDLAASPEPSGSPDGKR